MRVVFQGERGAFSEEAVRKFLGHDVELVPCSNFEEAFRRLDRGEADRGVLPMENTLAGSVHENFDLLLRYRMAILAETQVRIVLNLIAPPGVTFSKIHRVFSHPVALNQCHTVLRTHPLIAPVTFSDTIRSLRTLMEE